MAATLKQYFPTIRSREEVLAEISETPELLARYQEWNPEQQDRFLDYCTGQRAACYSSDLLLRQYRRVRNEKGNAFSYRDIQKVCTIVLYEKSPSDFHSFPENYRHGFAQQSDTGLQMDLLQEYLFIPLDIFTRILHNKGIRNQLEAWLTFLSTDEPEMIEKLILQYPEFRTYYEEIYALCRNTESTLPVYLYAVRGTAKRGK